MIYNVWEAVPKKYFLCDIDVRKANEYINAGGWHHDLILEIDITKEDQ